MPLTPLPSFAVAVIVTVPSAAGETSPVSELTLAMLSLEEDQVTSCSVAESGVTVADAVNETQTVASSLSEETSIAVTGT